MLTSQVSLFRKGNIAMEKLAFASTSLSVIDVSSEDWKFSNTAVDLVET